MNATNAICVWEWESRAHIWVPYPPNVSQHIESEFRRSVGTGKVDLSGQNAIELTGCEIDFTRLKQVNALSNEIFRVRRQSYPGTCPFARGVFWKWFTGYQWQQYDVDTSNYIEDAFQTKSKIVDLKRSPIRIPNIIYFSAMEQVNKKTKKVRRIEREETKHRYSQMNFETANGVAQHNVTGAQHHVTGVQHNVTGAQHNVTGAQHNMTGAQHNVTGMQHNVTGAQHNVSLASRYNPKPPSASATQSIQTSARQPDSAVVQKKRAVPASVGTKVIVHTNNSITQAATQSHNPLMSSNHTITNNSINTTAMQPQFGFMDLNSSLNASGLGPCPSNGSLQSNSTQLGLNPGYSLNSTVAKCIPSINQNSVAMNPIHRTSLHFPVGSSQSNAFSRPQPRMQTNNTSLNGGTNNPTALWPPASSDTTVASGSNRKPRKIARSEKGSSTTRKPTSVVSGPLGKFARRVHDGMQPDDECAICLESLSTPSDYDIDPTADVQCTSADILQLLLCKHMFHRICLQRLYESDTTVNGCLRCPTCKTIHGVMKGNQPDGGTMRVSTNITDIPGYPGHGSIVIVYSFNSGVQGPNHPNPGQRYTAHAFPRTCYLPNSPKGQKVLRLLKVAFDRQLVFTVGRSVTTGQDNSIVWNDIHHKTEGYGNGSGYGYPDPSYLDNVLAELAAHGVTDDT